MKQKITFLLVFMAIISGISPLMAQSVMEKQIFSTTFQDWNEEKPAVSPVSVIKQTNFSHEELTFNLTGIWVDPDGTDAKFTSAGVTPGFLRMEKQANDYASSEMAIELSPLKSVTNVEFMVAATGSNRGMKLWKKTGDGEWVLIFNEAANPASGMKKTVAVNEENVALKFTNFAPSQYAFLLNLDIYGMVAVTAEQVTLTTSVVPEGAGSIQVRPSSPEYDKGTEVQLATTPNFGYKFIKWTDGNGKTLSENSSFSYQILENSTIQAVYEKKDVYELNINTTGGAKKYMVKVIPAPTLVNGKQMYEADTEISLQPVSNQILTFNHWENGSTDPARIFRINENMSITANYSTAEYIVGWDFGTSDPKQDRAADFMNETTNAGMFQSLTADGTVKSWLAKGDDLYQEGRHAAINWNSSADKAYFQASFATNGYRNIRVQSSMLSCYFSYAVQNLEWSKDGKNFESLTSLTFDNQKTWYDLNATLPAEAENADKIFLRWIPDYTKGSIGNPADKDGTSITDIFVLADKEIIEDHTAPILLSSIPANGDSNASANGAIILNFNERVQAATANCLLNGEIIEAIYNNTTVIFNYSGLPYNTACSFIIPEGAISDMSGNHYPGMEISFQTMSKVQPESRLHDIIVAADGSGDFRTVSEAVAAAPAQCIKPYLIFIKEGTYKEHVEIPVTKPYIHLIGQDPSKVIITDDQLCGGDPAVTGKPALHVSQGATVVVNAANFYAENISFENSWGIDKNEGPQALAIFTNNDRIILNNCRIRSYQDSYLTSTRNVYDRHYLNNCLIEGAVDFIYGGGDVYFDNCKLNIVRKSGGYIVAPSHKADTKWGYVFANNTITAPAPANETSVWLGRPWKDAPKTVFLNTTSEITIPAAGWYDNMGAIPAIFADYNTMDAQGNKIDLSHRIEDYWYWKDDSKTEKVTGKAKNKLTDEEAAQYTIKNVLAGADQWQPNLFTEKTEAPVIRYEGGIIKWDAVPYAISYVILQNGKVTGFTKDLHYAPLAKENAYYEVHAVNEAGGLSTLSNRLDDSATAMTEQINQEVCIANIPGGIRITNISQPTTVAVYMADGRMVNRFETNRETEVSLATGTYIIHLGYEKSVKRLKVTVY